MSELFLELRQLLQPNDAGMAQVKPGDRVQDSPEAIAACLPVTLSDREIYFLSGLGADWRVFQRLQIEGYRPVHISWERPRRGEAIEAYARRLLAQVTSENPILVGLSFGGLMAVEMAKLCNPDRVIVISSAVTADEIPFYFKVFRWLPLQLVVPFKQLLWAIYGLLHWLFDLDQPDDQSLFKEVLTDTDPHFLRWAMNRVVGWRNQVVPDNLVHIHGGRDRIFPVGRHRADVVLPEGGHLMVLNRASAISQLLMQTLSGASISPKPSGPEMSQADLGQS